MQNKKKTTKIVHFKAPQQTVVMGWYLKKTKKRENYAIGDIPNIGIQVVSYINPDAFTGFIRLPRPSFSDFGYATIEWINDHDVLREPENALITFNGKIFWEVKDIQRTDKANRVLIILERLE